MVMATISTSRQTALTGFAAAWATVAPTWDQSTRIAWPQQGKRFTPPNVPYLDIVLTNAGGSNQAVTRLDVFPAVFDVNLFVPAGTLDDQAIGLITDDVITAFRAMIVDPSTFKRDIGVDDFGDDKRGYVHVRCRMAMEFRD